MMFKLNIDKLNMILMCFTFYEPSIIPHYVFIAFRYMIIIWTISRCWFEYQKIKKVLLAVLLYGITTIVSSIYNEMPTNTVVASFFFLLHILSVYLLSVHMIKKYSTKECFKVLLGVFLTICVLTDIPMLFIDYDFNNSSEEYLIGNKFVVSYVHCFTSALFFARVGSIRKENAVRIKARGVCRRFVAYLFALYSLLICWIVTCSTGLISTVAMILILILPENIIKFISSGKKMILVTLIVTILMFGSFSLLTQPIIQNFVQNVLGKSTSFTGRIQIWAIIFEVISRKPIIGYGYYNNIIEMVLGYGNPQNGVLKCLIDTGILGLLFYACIVMCSFKITNVKEKSESTYILSMIAFYYAMLVASLVEINLTHLIVFLCMSIVAALNAKDSEIIYITGYSKLTLSEDRNNV